jgi:hypothetical protein
MLIFVLLICNVEYSFGSLESTNQVYCYANI